MIQHINDIYEHGVLKPLVPLDLAEREIVSLFIEKSATNGATTDQAKPSDVPARSMIGLFADEPELMDQIMESVYEHRNRPLRIDE